MKRIFNIKLCYISAVLLFFVLETATAQDKSYQQTKDSLTHELNQSQNEGEKARLLYLLSENEFINEHLQKAIEYAEKSQKMAINTNNKQLQSQNNLIIAQSYHKNDQKQQALEYYIRAANAAEKAEDKALAAFIYSRIAVLNSEIQAYNKAVEYNQKAADNYRASNQHQAALLHQENAGMALLKAEEYQQAIKTFESVLNEYKKTDNKNKQIATLENLVFAYRKRKQYDKALELSYEMYGIYEETGDLEGRASCLNNIGYIYIYQDNYEEALQAFKGTYNADVQTGDHPEKEIKTLINIGVCYQKLNKTDDAVKFLLKAGEKSKTINRPAKTAEIDNMIALAYFYNEDYYNAGLYSQKAIEAARTANDKNLLQNSYKIYSQILQKGNEHEKALEYYQKFLNIRDSLLVEKRLEQQKIANRQYMAEKSEKELKLSLADEEMKDMALKQLKLEGEKKEKEMQLLRRDKELREATLKQQQQALILEKQQLEAEKRKREIETLEKEKKIKELALERKEAEEAKRQKEIALLKSEKERQRLKLEKQEEAKRFVQWVFSLFFVILILILISLIIARRSNKKLSKQKKEIEAKNTMLEEKNEHILMQNEELNQQKEEIISQRDQIEKQRDDILKTNTELERKEMVLSSQLAAINSSVGAVEFDLEGKFLTANQRFLDMIALRETDIKGKHHSQFMSAEKRNTSFYINFWKNLLHDKPHAGGHQYFFSGREKWFYESFTPVKDENGKPVKILALVVDITKQREQEEKLKEQARVLKEANDAITAKNEEITQQKRVIEKKNESIMDSIHYARRIQAAILPPNQLLQETFPEHFVLFKPRDIVSGDFYWINSTQARRGSNQIIIAAADCTGHGVPGAFMSMLGVSLLNEIVNIRKVTQANIILNELRAQVKSSLRQTGREGEAKDGMDIALCSIDPVKRTMQFAGAYNPLVLIRKSQETDDAEIVQIKADKMPIGIYYREKGDFTNHEIQLKKDDTFYIFSDGFADQIGGNRGRKFMSKRFKSLLKEIHKKPMGEQKTILENKISDWMNNTDDGKIYEQVDDMLIIGLRV